VVQVQPGHLPGDVPAHGPDAPKGNGKGQLTDQLGNLVLGQNGQPVKLNADGTVDDSKVGVFKLTNPAKAGNGQFTGTAAGRADGIAKSGVLETSGVDAGRTMIEMMASLRAYEANQKTITSLDSTLEKTGQVGNLPA
ncbi:MAG TPA: flagellar basal body rod C-terminal domain-containing protein, partial [Baekduia sp.]|nr:flagellar basal body rod C-terminal domain-containing protein [Baekduia sp.]